MEFSDAFIDSLVRELNEEFDIPFLTEGQEERIVRWAVRMVAPHIPHWVLHFMLSAANGLTMEELTFHEETIVREVNLLLDIPWVPEEIEPMLIRPVVRQLLSYAVEGKALPV